MYNRYAESARVNWTRNFAASDPKHEKQWMELITPKSIGLILRSITTDYKFVSGCLFVHAVSSDTGGEVANCTTPVYHGAIRSRGL